MHGVRSLAPAIFAEQDGNQDPLTMKTWMMVMRTRMRARDPVETLILLMMIWSLMTTKRRMMRKQVSRTAFLVLPTILWLRAMSIYPCSGAGQDKREAQSIPSSIVL